MDEGPDDASMTVIGAPMQATTTDTASKGTASNLTCNGAGLMRASDLDLRKTKGELFSKLTERQPQQMIVTTALNRRSSDENINSNSLASFKGLNRVEFSCHGSSTNFSAPVSSQQQERPLRQEQPQNNYSAHQHKQQKVVTMNHQAETTMKQQASLVAIKQEPPLFARVRSKWYTNEEVASILTSYHDHPEWQSNELQIRPKSGAVLLYSREKVRYRQDGYCWKKRKNGRTTREDHMKLKVQGIECIYGCYVHSALLPTFHRRCYWLLENPDIVLVHYLNQPPDDKNKMILTFNPGLLESDTKRRWTNEEIIEEIGSVFGGISQIHRTLSINFPTANQSLPVTQSVNCDPQINDGMVSDAAAATGPTQLAAATGPKRLMNEEAENCCETDSNNNNSSNNLGELGMVVINERNGNQDEMQEDNPMQSIGAAPADFRDSEQLDEDGDDDEDGGESDEGMITINQDNGANDYNQARQHSTSSRFDNFDGDVGCERSRNNDLIDNCDDQQRQQQQRQMTEDAAMTFDVVIDPRRQVDGDNKDGLTAAIISNAEDEQAPASQSNPVMIMYSMKEPGGPEQTLLIDNVRDHHLGEQNHQLVEADSKSFCDQEKSIAGAASAMQGMSSDTGSGPYSPVTQIYNKIVDDIETYAIPLELNQFDPNHNHHHHHHHHHHQQHHQHLHHHQDTNDIQSMDTSEPDQQSSPKQVIGQRPYQIIQRDASSSGEGQQFRGDHQDKTDCDPVQLIACDLFVNCNEPGDDPTAVSSDNVDELLSCQDPSDPLDLFSFKPLNCDSLKHQHHLLDVKSTTSETETLDRLSPINGSRQPPRCNSSDDAMQLSTQRVDQYLHHASINFLSNTSETSAPEGGDHQSLDNLADFRDQHQHADVTAIAHRSTASTEPSNSTSTSSLLNATGGLGGGGCSRLSGVSYASGQSADQGLPSSLGSNYNDSSTTSSSFIKLPLPQRQNSEQKEPSNSILSSLLPKALSLDGSDLSSTTHYGHAHTHHHHHQRASPLVGPYHTPGNARAASTHQGSRMNAYGQQPAGHMLLVPPSGGGPQQSLQQHRHHHYQRPSAPTISPTTGTYSLDSSMSGTSGKLLINGGGGGSSGSGQYRSGSMAATSSIASSMCYQPQAAMHQSQQQNIVEYARLADNSISSRAGLLPILDYVPNWSPSSGGTKVLLIGHWNSLTSDESELAANSPGNEEAAARTADGGNQTTSPDPQRPAEQQRESSFFVLFDDLVVPASLIQSNVLRCHSPYHKPGFIALKVVYKNLIVSEQVLFEIRPGAATAEPMSMIQQLATTVSMEGQDTGATSQRSSLGFDRPEASSVD